MLFSFPTEKILEKEQRQVFLRHLFRRIFLEDWGTKLIALGITAALWLGVTGLRAPVTKRITNVALNLSYSSEMELVNSPITEVDLVVTGDKSKLDRLRREDLIVSVDLSEVKAGERTIQLTPENINVELPSGLKIEEIQPNKIAVKLERVEERDVPVKPETEGALPEGFEIYSRTVSPPTVRVRGPESFVRALDSISTEKISLENQRANFTARQVELNVVNPKIRLLDTIVDVTFNIGEKRLEAVFSVPYENEGVARKARVILFAPNSILEQIKPEDLIVEQSRNEAGEIKPNVILPADLQNKVEVRNVKLN
jgi:hypothetical protein